MTVKTLSLIIVKPYDFYCSMADKLYRSTPKEHSPRVDQEDFSGDYPTVVTYSKSIGNQSNNKVGL